MKKNDFLNTLDRKLKVINEKERKDIIDEYRMHIDMKMEEGKSEEEAIEDFGNIDELVNEILDAYKINTKQTHNAFDAKVNTCMDELFEGLKRFLGSFASIEVDDVVKLIFEIFLIFLVLLALLQIPFKLISSLGSHLLHSISDLGIGSLLATIWQFMMNVAMVIIIIVIFLNLCSKRVIHYRCHAKTKKKDKMFVFGDFKNSFDFEKAKQNVQSFASRKANEQDIYEETEETLEDEKEEDKKGCHFGYYKGDFKNKAFEQEHVKKNASAQVGSVVQSLMRVFFCILMIPFLCIGIALCCVIGVMLVLSMEGFTLFGAYFLIIGGLIVTYACVSLLYKALWKRG